MLAKRFTRSGRIRTECLQLKKKSFGKNKKLKAQIATWSDEESSDEEEQEVANLCLMALEEDPKGEHCYKAKASCVNSWYFDSGCSRHMTGDKSRFLELKPKSGGVVTFSDNSKGLKELVPLVITLLFSLIMSCHRIGNIYMVHLDVIHLSNAFFVAYNEYDDWLWHRKLGHASISVLEKLISKDLVKESIHVVFDDNLLPRKDSCDDDDVGILEVNDGVQLHEMSNKKEAQVPPLEALKDVSLEEREVTYPREFNYVKGGEILGDPSKGVTTKASLRNACNYVAFM
ncbi:hypothetical protein V6N12_076330 [Hibiscus sabdariffa]|uniref:GAG-pre-integrase domain-containing protein n=1 Tax=Hibiscus sabdariffa TaxID=183260 RepID=A0ABR2D9H9_9ROSI